MATTSQDWQLANQQYLTAALEQVQAALQAYVARSQGKQPVQINQPIAFPDELSSPPALLNLCLAFDLTPFERDLLLLCAGVELSASLAQLCATAQGNSQTTYPTFSLALAALPNAYWSALIPIRPLRRWRLIEVSPGDSLTQSRLRIDERVLHYLKGINYLDDRLSGVMRPVAIVAELPPSQLQIAHHIATIWSSEIQSFPVIQLSGNDPDGALSIAAMACALLGVQLHQIRATDIPTATTDREAMTCLWEREAILSQSALLLNCTDLDSSNQRATLAFLEALPSMTIVLVHEPLDLRDRPNLRLDVQKPTSSEQYDLWQTTLNTLTPDFNGHLSALSAHFNLSAPTIYALSNEFKIQNSKLKIQNYELLWQMCRTQSRTRLDNLAQRIQPMTTWDDLVLPESQKQTLRDIAAQVKQRTIVYETWEFATRSANGLGISALFAGASGTGKTMAAEVIAQELQLDLYRIDLSQVVSKYIGETEKNLRRVFEAAETGGAILLFDEADALFGKRSEVKDSHDRYANIEVSYLLQRMEAYRGLAILTTNLRSAIDPAFLRRIRFVVQFPFPDAAQRTEIWQRIFPAKLPTEGLDYRKLAQLNVAGGNIRNIALNAAFLAADSGESLQMKHLLRAAQSEYTKLEKTLTDAEARGWV